MRLVWSRSPFAASTARTPWPLLPPRTTRKETHEQTPESLCGPGGPRQLRPAEARDARHRRTSRAGTAIDSRRHHGAGTVRQTGGRGAARRTADQWVRAALDGFPVSVVTSDIGCYTLGAL